MAKICRTCTQTIIGNDYFYLHGTSFVSDELRFKDLLNICIPDFNMDFASDSVICRNCTSSLVIGFLFKTETIKRYKLQNQQNIVNKDHDCYTQKAIFEGGSLSNGFNFTSDSKNETITSENGSKEIKKIIKWDDENNVFLQAYDTVEEFIEDSSGDNVNVEDKSFPSNDEINVSHEIYMETHDNMYDSNSSCYSNGQKQIIIKRFHICSICNFHTDSITDFIMHKRIHIGKQEPVNTHTGECSFNCPTCGEDLITSQLFEEHLQIHNTHCNDGSSVISDSNKFHPPTVGVQEEYENIKKGESIDIQAESMALNNDKDDCFQTEKLIEDSEYSSSKNEPCESSLQPNFDDPDENVSDEIESDKLMNTELQMSCVTKVIKSCIELNSSIKKHKRDIKRPYSCNLCSFKSESKAGLLVHIRIHTGEKPFHCYACPYQAKRKAHLQEHIKIHTGERPFKCDACSRSFISKHFLQKHIRIHSGEKPYHCNQCSYKAAYKLSVKNHVQKVHLGIIKAVRRRPSICPVCGKCLSTTSSLNAHMKIHAGIKSHLCELCGTYFREITALKNHMRTHTGEKPFKCTKCDYIATRKAHLQDHMQLYGNHDKLFNCEICEKRYATSLLLCKHKNEEHGIQKAN